MAANNMPILPSVTFFIAITSAIFGLFIIKQPQPYMDEIFHIPQAQNYCAGNLSHWNSKITTLPGLYIVSLIFLRICKLLPFVGSFFDTEQPCSTLFLRSTNLMFMLVNFWLLYELSFMINSNCDEKEGKGAKFEEHQGKKKKKFHEVVEKTDEDNNQAVCMLSTHCFANAFVLSFFPLLYFFAFLYYTDQGSTSMVLITYWFSLQESHTTAALTGAVAICFRQTNIIWVAFIAGSTLLRELGDDLPGLHNGVLQYISHIFLAVRNRIGSLILKLVPYALVGISFCIFVIKNNGVVVGDRSSHQACLNIPQIFYFIGFTMFFSFPLFFSLSTLRSVKERLNDCLHSKLTCFLYLCGIIAIILSIRQFTYVHEYLLADNRHYTFYIWRKLFQRHWIVKYLLIPCYLYGGLVINQQLLARNSIYLILLLAASTILVTVPQQLLELRYFIIPYILLRIHIPLPSYLSLLLEMALYLIINCATVALFLYKPFYWHGSDDIQRFMW